PTPARLPDLHGRTHLVIFGWLILVLNRLYQLLGGPLPYFIGGLVHGGKGYLQQLRPNVIGKPYNSKIVRYGKTGLIDGLNSANCTWIVNCHNSFRSFPFWQGKQLIHRVIPRFFLESRFYNPLLIDGDIMFAQGISETFTAFASHRYLLRSAEVRNPGEIMLGDQVLCYL